MDTPRALCLGHALDAVGARLELEAAVSARAADDEGDLLIAAQPRFIQADDLDLVAPALGVHAVHAEQVIGEQGAFLSPCAAAYLDDNVALVVGVFGQEQNFQLLFEGGQAALCFIELRSGKLPQLVVGIGIL